MESADGRTEAVRHLRDALAADDESEMDYRLKQALQLLDADDVLS